MAGVYRVIRLLMILLLYFCSAFPASVASPALRAVSFYPGHTDNVLALGGTLVGIAENDTLEDAALNSLPRLSLRSGAEAVLALRPDVVLTRGLAMRANPGLYSALAQAGVRVESLEPPAWDDFPAYLRRLALILNLDPEPGLERLEALRRDIAERAERAQKAGKRAPRFFIEATSRELRTCSPDSWAARLAALAGGINAASGARPLRSGSAIAPWGLERTLKLLDEGLDVYIVQRGPMNTDPANPLIIENIMKHHIKSVGILEAWLSRPSLPGLERGGRALLRAFYGMED